MIFILSLASAPRPEGALKSSDRRYCSHCRIEDDFMPPRYGKRTKIEERKMKKFLTGLNPAILGGPQPSLHLLYRLSRRTGHL
jgi:hypothetical protein